MPVVLDTDRTPELPGSNALHIGLVNNMPDGALQATERQFVKLLDSASRGIAVRLSLYALPDVPRSDWGRDRINRYYAGVESLWNNRLDGLIVTGTEPVAPHLADEPYWESLTKVFDWAESNTLSTVCSCLAAHAAILHLDGIARSRLRDKHFGVFSCTKTSDHALTAGSPLVLQVPHSRWNDVSERDLTDCGYRILTRARNGGVDAFVKQKNSLFVFLQGHPEYEANTLLLEYRRDIGRYLRRERDKYPQVPQGYFDGNVADALCVLQERALSNRHEDLLADFPLSLLEDRVKNRWHSTGARLYGNWLRTINAQKQQRSRQAPAGTVLARAKVKKPLANHRAQL